MATEIKKPINFESQGEGSEQQVPRAEQKAEQDNVERSVIKEGVAVGEQTKTLEVEPDGSSRQVDGAASLSVPVAEPALSSGANTVENPGKRLENFLNHEEGLTDGVLNSLNDEVLNASGDSNNLP